MAASVGHGTWKNNVSPNLRFSMIPMMTTAEREFVLGVLGRAYSQEAVAASHFRVVRPGGALHGGVPTFGVHLQTYLMTRENVQGIADEMTAAGYAGNSMSTKFVANGSMVYVVPDYDSNMLVPDRQQLLDIIEKGMLASGVKVDALPKFRAWSMSHTGDYIDQSQYPEKVDDFAQGILNAESTAEWADSLPQRGGVKGIFRSEVGTDASSIAGFHSEIDIRTHGRDSRVVRGLSAAKRRSRFVHYLWAAREIGRIVNTQEQQLGDWRKAAITYANSEGSGIVSGSFQAVASRQADRQQVRSEEVDRIVSDVMRPNRTQQQQLRGRHIEGDFQTTKKQSRPSSRVRELTKQYMLENGLKYDSSSEGEFVIVDYDRAKRVADEYERMQHRPGDAEVSASYEAFKKEILAQYNFLVDQGVKFVPWAGGLSDRQPYANSREMLDDVAKGHLYYYKTVNPKDPGSFGQTEGEQELSSRNNPMLEDIGKDVKDSDGNVHKQTYNDIFRAVHDYFGHGKEGYQFGWHGEYNAWRQHARTFSDDAQSALASETTGQNSWQNFGEHIRRNDGSIPERDDNDFIPLTDYDRRPFAEQKVGLMPKWVVSLTGDYPKLERAPRREAKPKRGPSLSGSFQPAPPLRSTQWDRFFGKSVLVDEDGDPLLWFHGTAVPFLLRHRKGMSKDMEGVSLPRGSFWGLFGPGQYFTEDPNIAGNYAGVLFDHRLRRAAAGRKYAINPIRIAQAEEVIERENISEELFGGPSPQTVPAYVRAERPLNMDDSVTSGSEQAQRWIDALGKLRDGIKSGRVKIEWPGGKAHTAENIHKAFENMIRRVRDNPEQIYKRQARLGKDNPLRIFGKEEPELRENHELDHTTNGDVFRVVFEKGITHGLLVDDRARRNPFVSDTEETQVLHDMTRALWKIMDVDALRHLGGLIVGEGRTHEVVIALENDQVRNAFDKVAADTEYIQKAEAWATAFAQAVEGSGSEWDFLGPTQVGVDSFVVNAWREVGEKVLDDFTVVFGSQDRKKGVFPGEKPPSVTIRVDDNKNRERQLREATRLLSAGALPHMKRAVAGSFQAARRTEAKSEEELWEELQQRHMEKGDEEEVDLADAIPGLDPEAVAGMRAVDEMRNMQGRPVLKEDAETFARAEKLMEDPEALEKRLTWAYENNQTLNSEETYAARLFLRERVMEAVKSKDPVAIRKWIRIANTYRDIRAEQARALRIGQDFEKDPSKRHRNMVSETLIRPNTSEKDKLRRIDSKMDGATASEREQLKGEKEEVLKQQAVRIAQIKQRLKDLGLDLDNEDNDWSSIRFTTRALRTISTAHATGSDMLYEWFIASLLWAPITQIRNISGNAAFSFWEHTFQRLSEVAMNKFIPVARLRGESDSDYKKRSREVRAKSATLQDFKWEAAGLWHSFAKAAMNGLTAFEVEAPTFAAELRGNRGSTKFDYDTSKVAIPGQFGRFVRLPLRFLVGMDEYAKTTNGHIVVYMVAARQATAEGLSDGTYAHTKRTMQLVNNPHSKAWTVAIAEADRLAFQERAGGFGQGLLALRQFTPGARYAFTFVTTPLNIFKVGFKKSPLGVINMLYKGAKHGHANLKWKGKGRSGHFEYTREQLVIDSAEQVLAFGALSVIAALAMPGDDELPLLTGTAPTGPRSSGERDLAYRVAPPMSFRFPGTNTWWSYAGIEPLAVTLSATVDVINNIVKAKNDSEADKISAAVGRQLSSLMNQVQDKTFMRGMSDLMNMFQQPEKGIARYVSNFAAAWVPNIIRAGLRETGSEVSYQKFAEEDLSGFWGKQTLRTLQNAFPAPFIAPPAKVDMWGNVVRKGGAPLLPSMGTDWIWRMLSPVRKFNTQLGPEQNLNRMMLNWNNQNPSDILAPRAPDMWLTYRKEKVLMTDEEYHDFMIDVGETSLQRATRRQNWNYDKPTLRDKEALLKIIEGARRNARLRLLGKLRRANDPRVEFRR